MFFDFIKKLFTGESSPETHANKAEPDGSDLVGFVNYVVRGLVTSPDKVNIQASAKDDTDLIEVRCEKSDIAKVIGKSGRTISAIRLLVNGAANRDGRQVKVDVID